jgi:hypothetical protein
MMTATFAFIDTTVFSPQLGRERTGECFFTVFTGQILILVKSRVFTQYSSHSSIRLRLALSLV